MEVFVTAVPGENGVENVDTIEYAGSYWLVPIWFDTPDGKSKAPARMVYLNMLPHQKGTVGHDFVLNSPLPNWIYDLEYQPQKFEGILVLDLLRLRYPLTRASS